MYSSLLLSCITLATSVSALANGQKRHLDGDCSAQPAGVSGYVNDPDTDTTFLNNPAYANAANDAITPAGYSEVFQDLQASVIDNTAYLGYDSLQSYDPSYCASRCNSGWPGCSSFNIYFERDPTIDPGVNCTNPPSLTYIKCAYYSACLSSSEATNDGQYCQDFHMVIAGSNAYEITNNCTAASSSSTVISSTTTTSTSMTTAAPTSATTTSIIVTSAVPTTAAPTSVPTISATTTTSTAATSASATCSACASGLAIDSNGNRYNVQCDTNYWGSDLGPVAASCYEDCFDVCDQNPDCNAFSWDLTAPPVSCWPKSISSSSTAQPYSEQGVVFAQLIPVCTTCVSGKTTDGSGKAWQVSCDSNFWGNDFIQKTAYCYEDCFDLCDSQSGCTAFTFDETTNLCWLKNPAVGTAQPYSEAQNVFAQMLPTCASCQAGSYTDGSGEAWKVSCGSNFWGYDFVQHTADCYNDCFNLCDEQSGCTAFTFDETTNLCWLKNPAVGTARPYSEANNVFAQMVQSPNSWQSWTSWNSWNPWA